MSDNTGELADEILAELTPVEELVRDLANDRTVYEYQVEEAIEHIETAQGNASEILDQYEDQHGPI